MTKYEKLRNEVLDLEKNRGIVNCQIRQDLHKRKMKAFKDGEITKEQAIKLENRIDNL